VSIWVLCPSRGRPDKATECYQSFIDTHGLTDTKMSFIVDADDPTFVQYEHLPMLTYEHEGGGMGPPLNAGALDIADECDVIGFVGDDHRFRSAGWDVHITKALASIGGGIAFGDDLGQRQNLATQVFISSPVVKALGWMALPGATHLYLDNTWMVLGQGMKHLVYVPSAVIEHMHPVFGKAEMDAGYEKANSPAMYSHDRAAFEAWMVDGMLADVEKARASLG
jgi:hypothetical protein